MNIENIKNDELFSTLLDELELKKLCLKTFVDSKLGSIPNQNFEKIANEVKEMSNLFVRNFYAEMEQSPVDTKKLETLFNSIIAFYYIALKKVTQIYFYFALVNLFA
jgi:hypothetical protein